MQVDCKSDLFICKILGIFQHVGLGTAAAMLYSVEQKYIQWIECTIALKYIWIQLLTTYNILCFTKLNLTSLPNIS